MGANYYNSGVDQFARGGGLGQMQGLMRQASGGSFTPRFPAPGFPQQQPMMAQPAMQPAQPPNSFMGPNFYSGRGYVTPGQPRSANPLYGTLGPVAGSSTPAPAPTSQMPMTNPPRQQLMERLQQPMTRDMGGSVTWMNGQSPNPSFGGAGDGWGPGGSFPGGYGSQGMTPPGALAGAIQAMMGGYPSYGQNLQRLVAGLQPFGNDYGGPLGQAFGQAFPGVPPYAQSFGWGTPYGSFGYGGMPAYGGFPQLWGK